MRKITKWFLCLVLVMAVVCGAMTAFAQEQTYVAENVQTGQQYADLTTAALSATKGQTVKLLQNAEAQVLTVAEDTTLDLNGYELKAVYASVFGHMVDTSEANTGALKVDAAKLLINTANKQLPVKTDKGYQFVEVVGFNTAWMNENTFVFQPMFEAAANTLLKNGVANTGVTIQVNVTWKPYEGSEDLDSRTFKYGDNFVTQFVNSYNASTGKYGKMFTLTLVDPQNYVDLSCSVQVVSTTRVVFAPAPAPAEVTEEVQLVNEQASAVVPVGAKLTDSDVELSLTTEELDTTTVVVGDGEEARSMDIHVEGLAKDNTVPVIVTVNEMAPEFMNRGNITLYHVENGEAVEMTRVYTVEEVDEHNEFYYDIETGTVTMAMASFSEVTAVSSSDNGWKGELDYSWYDADKTQLRIANADQLAGFGAIVGGMAEGIGRDTFAGKTVTLIADINLGDKESENNSDVIFYPIGYHSTDLKYEKTNEAVTTGFYNFEGTFDGNGNTISSFYQNTWEMKGDHDWYDAKLQYYRDGFGLFGKVYGGTVKNLIVDNFSCDSEIGTAGTIAAYADGATFENITIFNCNPRVYNIGNGGIVGCVGWYAKETGLKTTFTNITVDQTNKVSALWGTYDASCGGILGQYYPTSGQSSKGYPVNGGIHFENCHVAAIMDVNNDVCANYQYYWYRYSGMLLGSVRTNTTAGGYTVADTNGITAKNCTYTYGSWNEYWYCELVKNSSASYTHDYQFGRLTNIDSLSEISADGVWLKEGNFALVSADRKSVECYHIFKDSNGNLYRHFHDKADESNPNIYEDFDLNGDGKLNDLKEDRQRYYLPFGQVMNGYGWGVKPIYEFKGFTLVPDGSVLSGEKFQIKKGAELTYTPGQTIKLSDIVDLTIDSSKLSQSSLYASASPVKDTDNVVISYSRDVENWLNNTITFSDSSVGDAKLVITDHFYCEPTVIILKQATTVAMIGDKEYTSLQDALNAAQDGQTVTLVADVKASKYLDIYTPNNGETERSITLDLAGNSITWSDNYKYAYYPLVFVGINQTLTIKNGSIIADEHVAVGAYGHVNLENVNVSVKNPSKGEQAVCIWNWSEDDTYFEDCQFLITGSATITGGSIEGGILAEGTVELAANAGFDKLYLNTKTGYGKAVVPTGYGMVKTSGYYTNLHAHDQKNEGACSTCGFAASYVKTDLTDIKSTDIVVIAMTDGKKTWALNSANSTGRSPVAEEITVSDGVIYSDVSNALQWNINTTNGSMIIYPNGDYAKYLYCRDDSDSVRAGQYSNSDLYKQFVVNGDYLQNINTGRYLGVNIKNSDWRAYISTSDLPGQSVVFYVMRTNCNHNNEDLKEKRDEIAATCTQAGHAEGVYCLSCDTYVSGGKLIDVTGHKFGDPTDKSVAATCEKDGKNIYTCAVCNKIRTETVKAGHTEEIVAGKDATCTETGLTEGKKCTVCGVTTVEQTVIDALGHTEETVAGKAATCTETGLTEGKKCSVCGTTTVEQEEIPVIAHTEETVAGKAATCTETGLTEGKKCTVCGTTTVEQKEIPVIAHTEVIDKAVEATCTTAGKTEGKHCSVCNEVIVAQETVAALGHSYVEGVCGTCGDDVRFTVTFFVNGKEKTEKVVSSVNLYQEENVGEYTFVGWTEDPNSTEEPEMKSGVYVVESDVTLYAVYSYSKEVAGAGAYTLVTDVTTLSVGDQVVIVARDNNVAMSTEQKSNNRGQTTVTKSGNTVAINDTVQKLTLEAGTKDETLAFSTGSGYLYTASSSNNHLKTQTTKNDNGSWKITIAADGTATIVAQGTNSRRTMQYNQSSSLFACYEGASQKALCIYKLTASTQTMYTTNPVATEEPSVCTHTNTTTTTVDATCIADGSITVTCDDCTEYKITTVIPATGEHVYVNGICTGCGEEDPDAGDTTQSVEATLSFANKAQRTSFSTSKQVWEQNGITLTNDKGSGSDVGDYANPVRLYKNSKVTITAPGNITKIVFDCNSNDYATALKNSIGSTATVSSDKVTVILDGTSGTYTVANLTAQVRIDSITVTYTPVTKSVRVAQFAVLLPEQKSTED